MKIHLKQIPPEGLHLEGEDDCLIADLEAEGIRCAGPLRYSLDVGISGHALWVSGSLSQPVELECVACLNKFVESIQAPAFAIHKGLHGPEVVDLGPAMREDILLNLPAHPRCDANGERRCERAATGDTTAADRQSRAAKREHDWGALDQLKLKD